MFIDIIKKKTVFLNLMVSGPMCKIYRNTKSRLRSVCCT